MKTINQRYFIGGGGIPRSVENQLKEIGAKYKIEPIFSNFHGSEIQVEKFRGRGSRNLNEKIYFILEK